MDAQNIPAIFTYRSPSTDAQLKQLLLLNKTKNISQKLDLASIKITKPKTEINLKNN